MVFEGNYFLHVFCCEMVLKWAIFGTEWSWKGPRGWLWPCKGVIFCTLWSWKGASLDGLKGRPQLLFL